MCELKSIIPLTVTANYVTGVSPSGKAAGFDPAMRGFESLHPSHSFESYLTDSSLVANPGSPKQNDVTLIAVGDGGSARLAKSYIHPRLRPEQGTYPCRK